MKVLALGPMDVHLNGQSYSIGGAKQEALLARLLVAQGRPVPVFRLCEELWDDRTPRNPVHALQARVSRLRSALPMLDIQQVGAGYRLDHLKVHTDIACFERLREEGGWLLADGVLLHAAERLREALGMWRGPAFADVPSIPSLQAESARLEKLWAAALADRIDIDLALGNESEVIPELAALIEANPLSERLWGQLMVALYRDDHVQEALETYTRAREIFSERFGVEPNGALGQLHVRILKQEPSESLLRLPVATQNQTRSNSAPVPHAVLNASVTSNGTETLAALLQQRPALIVTGPTGIGKTHLLRSVRAHLEAQHNHVPLLPASELSQPIPLGVFTGVAGSLSEDWRTAVEVIETFARHRSRTVLLVDNVEQLDDASLFVVNQLVTTARVPVIMTAPQLTSAPDVIRALYDSGELTEVALQELSDHEADELSVAMTGGPLTPNTRVRILQAAAGNPLRMREIVTGSKASGRLVPTDFGWELHGHPTPSARLAQLTSARFDGLDAACLESLTLVAIAGQYPGAAMDASHRRTLARADVLALSDNGWLRLADPIDREVLRTRCSNVLWTELTREAIQVLTSDLATAVPQARHRAHLLMLDLGDPIDVAATLALAQRALGTFDERLALRAAEAVITQESHHAEAHRIAGVAASILRRPDAAEAAFEKAHRHADSALERVTVAMDHAQHHGLRRHDAKSALKVIEQAFSEVTGAQEIAHLERSRMRWMAVAGMGGETTLPPEMPADAAGAMGLIVVGFSGVITGPLEEAHRVLNQLHQVPSEIIDLVPGGKTLITLIEAMAVSYSGDLSSALRMFHQQIAKAATHAPESLGEWEYALGFGELLSGDASKAYPLAVAAVEHLKWRDTTGLLPAAQALSIASAEVTGHHATASQLEWDDIPQAAINDPKVVMLRRWTEARIAYTNGRRAKAARILVETAHWLLEAQHSYFAGMCAHYAVRTGHEQQEALAVLKAANAVAGGGLLALLLRHAETTLAQEFLELSRIAREAHDLGLMSTAADTWTVVVKSSGDSTASVRLQRQRAAIEQLYAEAPGLVSWIT